MAFNSGPKRCFPVKVLTMDADLEFHIEVRPSSSPLPLLRPSSSPLLLPARADATGVQVEALGRDLFDLVCRTIGLREIWYFGLQYETTKGHVRWLQMGKKVAPFQGRDGDDTGTADGTGMGLQIRKQGVDTKRAQFHFLAKYFPESVEDELIQDSTKHLFFLQVLPLLPSSYTQQGWGRARRWVHVQVWESVVSGSVYVPAEAGVLLAAYAVQGKSGDGSAEAALDPAQLLPASVLGQYQLTPQMWAERIRTWWLNNKVTRPLSFSPYCLSTFGGRCRV